MPSIADLYSTIDSYKRRAADVLSDPQNSLMQMLGYANDRARNYNESLAQASKERGYGPKTQELAQAMAEAYNPVGMTTWHGSPHTFNKFDMSKIGTGEGAQAYGHGLYLAENPNVAKEYRDALSTYKTTLNGEPLAPSHPLFSEGMSIAANGYKKALKQAEDALKSGFVNPEYAQKQIDNIKSLKGAKIEQSKQGNLYKVDLPDEHIAKMLDWDKPLSEQHPDVQKAIKKTKELLPPNAMDDLGGDLSLLYGKDITPKDFLNTWESLTGSVGSGEAALAKHGIPGIKYLDETSRQTGKGTRNFVIFDPNLAKIEERNSIPIPQDPHAPNYLEDVHKALSSKFEYPREQAFKIAQENAALPVSEGGLGLPKDNTPEMRAKAMGYETPMYHGTNEDIEVFNTKGKGKTAGAGAFFTTNPTTAETYVSSSGGGNILPVMVKKNDLLNVNARGKNWSDIYTNQLGAKSGKIKYSPEELGLDLNSATTTDELGMIAADLGKKGIEIKNVKDLGPNSHVMRAKEYLLNKYGIVPDEIWSNVTGKQFDESQKAMKKFYESQKSDIVALQDPSMIRSKFAAFDPKQMGNPDLLAGVLPLSLGGATLVGANNDDVHSPNYLENLHKQLAQKPIDVTDVHAPNYLEDIHNQLANQQ